MRGLREVRAALPDLIDGRMRSWGAACAVAPRDGRRQNRLMSSSSEPTTSSTSGAASTEPAASAGSGSPAPATSLIEVRNAPERSRYEILVDGEIAGFTDYRPEEGSLVFDHTVVLDQYAGRGLASALARGALDDVRAQQARIVPVCSFIAGWVVKNPDYGDLVDEELLARLTAS